MKKETYEPVPPPKKNNKKFKNYSWLFVFYMILNEFITIKLFSIIEKCVTWHTKTDKAINMRE